MQLRKSGMWIILFLSAAVAVFGADPFVGTWKLNVEKTKVITGLPPKEGNLSMSLQGDHYVGTESYTLDNGIHVANRFTEPVNGGPLTYIEGRISTDGLTIAKKINTNTRQFTTTQGGKIIGAEQWVVSQDGKTVTAHVKGTNAQGKPFDRIEIWDRH